MEILELINHGSRQLKDKKICSHKLDSEILLSKVLDKTREELLINLNPLSFTPTKVYLTICTVPLFLIFSLKQK